MMELLGVQGKQEVRKHLGKYFLKKLTLCERREKMCSGGEEIVGKKSVYNKVWNYLVNFPKVCPLVD